jgi:hypothetical protein
MFFQRELGEQLDEDQLPFRFRVRRRLGPALEHADSSDISTGESGGCDSSIVKMEQTTPPQQHHTLLEVI